MGSAMASARFNTMPNGTVPIAELLSAADAAMYSHEQASKARDGFNTAAHGIIAYSPSSVTACLFLKASHD
ncbi:hypothetical protein LMG27174_00587 [Paraburkholderia rhynchosiae]|uniref:Uncharacterized protein n=1 Tax=Paraburkholderia rhynchosiae TaxID=487049 RepID=A0A6J4ZUH3_9BURK|nr:hypothetical protein LMG27174_00587 [Paraburkholderia rhynchosiae]